MRTRDTREEPSSNQYVAPTFTNDDPGVIVEAKGDSNGDGEDMMIVEYNEVDASESPSAPPPAVSAEAATSPTPPPAPVTTPEPIPTTVLAPSSTMKTSVLVSTQKEMPPQPQGTVAMVPSAHTYQTSTTGRFDDETAGQESSMQQTRPESEDVEVYVALSGSTDITDDPSYLSHQLHKKNGKPMIIRYDKDEESLFTPTLASGESKDTTFTHTLNGRSRNLNAFASSHIMRWKYAAEEGSAILRLPAVIGASALIGSVLYPIVTNTYYWSLPCLLIATFVITFCMMIIILDGRICGARNPTSVRAKTRLVITKYFNILRFVWGRGLLFIFVGCLALTLDHEIVFYPGLAMIGWGVITFLVGFHATHNVNKLKHSINDESYLWAKFNDCDPDRDGYIDASGFAELLWSLGIEFDDLNTLRAFQHMDTDNDNLISFDEFRAWHTKAELYLRR